MFTSSARLRGLCLLPGGVALCDGNASLGITCVLDRTKVLPSTGAWLLWLTPGRRLVLLHETIEDEQALVWRTTAEEMMPFCLPSGYLKVLAVDTLGRPLQSMSRTPCLVNYLYGCLLCANAVTAVHWGVDCHTGVVRGIKLMLRTHPRRHTSNATAGDVVPEE